MKTVFAIALTTALAGCAMPYEKQRYLARQDSSDDLCIVTIIKPEFKRAAEDELRSRNATCDWQRLQPRVQMYFAQRQASQAEAAVLLGAGLQLMQQSRPYAAAPAQAPTMTNCRTVYYSGGAQTTCY